MDEVQVTQPQAQNDTAVTDASPSASPADEPKAAATEQPKAPEAEAAPSKQAPTEPEAERPSRAERRIRQLSEKVRQARQTDQPGGQVNQPQFPQYQPGQEVSPEQLQTDVVRTASAIAELQVQRQLQQRDATSNLDRDTEVLPTKYDELNPSSAAYTPELDEAIAQEYQERAIRVVGYHPQTGQPITQLDPSVRLADIAERQVRASRAYAAKASAATRATVAKDADATAPRPGGDKPAEKEFKDLSIAEMEARLGFIKR